MRFTRRNKDKLAIISKADDSNLTKEVLLESTADKNIGSKKNVTTITNRLETISSPLLKKESNRILDIIITAEQMMKELLFFTFLTSNFIFLAKFIMLPNRTQYRLLKQHRSQGRLLQLSNQLD